MSGALKELLEYCRETQIDVTDYISDQKELLKIRNANPELNSLSDIEIDSIWSEFSTHFYCASFMSADSCMDSFREHVILSETYAPVFYGDDFIKWKQARSCKV